MGAPNIAFFPWPSQVPRSALDSSCVPNSSRLSSAASTNEFLRPLSLGNPPSIQADAHGNSLGHFLDLAELKCTHVSDDACKVDGNWQLVESKISKILGLAEPTTGRLKEKHDSISSDILRQSNLAMEIQILHEKAIYK